MIDYAKVIGWYDAPDQVYPVRVPPDDAPCPICGQPLGERTDATYTSIMAWAERGKSFFYGMHKDCAVQPHEHVNVEVMDWIERSPTDLS